MESKIAPEVKKLIEENAMALASISEKGTPHVIAVGYAKVVSDNKILITDNYMGHTVRNILQDNNVSLVVWNPDWKKKCTGFRLEGTAEYLTVGKWLDMIKRIPENKGEPCKGAILITVDKITKLA